MVLFNFRLSSCPAFRIHNLHSSAQSAITIVIKVVIESPMPLRIGRSATATWSTVRQAIAHSTPNLRFWVFLRARTVALVTLVGLIAGA